MKNYLLNFRWIRLFLFVISIWLLGSCSAFGQGWVKIYDVNGKSNLFEKIFQFKDSIVVINNDHTLNPFFTKSILIYDIKGNLIDSNNINYNFNSSNDLQAFCIDSLGNISFVKTNFSLRKTKFLKVSLKGNIIIDTLIDGEIIEKRISNDHISSLQIYQGYKIFDIDENFNLINEIYIKNLSSLSSVKKFPLNYFHIVGDTIINRDTNSIEIWKTILPVNIENFECILVNNIYYIINIDAEHNISIFKLDQNGNLLKQNVDFITIPYWGLGYEIKFYENRIFIISNGINNKLENKSSLIVVNENLDIECSQLNIQSVNSQFYFMYDITSLKDFYYLVGNSLPIGGSSKVQIAKISNKCYLSTNELQLNYYLDDNKNCLKNTNESFIKNKLVSIKNINQNLDYFSSETDTIIASLDTGSYVIHPIAPVYYQLCEDSITFTHNKYYDTVRIEIPLKQLVICPYLEVDISTPILRRCIDNTYSVHYCNQGTADANGVYIEVELDKWLSYKSSSIPLKNQQGNLLTFDIGNLPIGECGDFQILTYLICDSTILGQTHCTNAHIFPDSLCLPTNGWDGSRIRVSGQCLGDSIRFEIKNASNSPMMQQSNYIVVEDEIIMSKKPFQLGANETLKINIPVFGRTYRLEAEQSFGHPGSSKPTVTVENCGTGPVSLGFVNQFYQDDADPFIDIDCQQNRGSYDPNDKQGYPLGYGKNHFIEQNQSIEYLIRFQNTGSDTAFTVRIQDTLSNYLDPTSLIPGASSHPYSYRIFGNGIVEFLFDPIALPDSNVNNAKSIGFVKFTISQKKDLPIGSEIKNNALIYFDYNSPIVTNSTLHTVGKNFITITETSEIELSSMKIYPNPFAQEAIIELDNDNTEKTFELYDLFGRQIRIEQFNGNRLNFKRNLLQSGIYFFKITSKNKPLTQGKLIIH